MQKSNLSDEQARTLLIAVLGENQGLKVYDSGQGIVDAEARSEWYTNFARSLSSGDFSKFNDMTVFKNRPVDIKTFIEDKFFLDKKDTVYPQIMKELQELNNGSYVEAVFTGGIGSGKTTAAHYTIAYQLYILSCMYDPHTYFNLDKASEILFVFQSLSATHAKTLEYNRFRAMLEQSNYFTRVWPMEKMIESRIVFPSRIEIVPLSGAETAAIGQNVIGGLLDEVNYMAVIDSSRKNVEGGTYDQAWALYNSIARRRKSRFTLGGTVYGMLCLVSSKRYPGQFTDIKAEEANRQIEETGSSDIFIFDKRAWDVKPAGSYSGDTFKVFTGDTFRKPRILDEDSKVGDDEKDLIVDIPIEYESDFKRDLVNAMREIAGVSTFAKHPYIMDTEMITECMATGHVSIFGQDVVDFQDRRLSIHRNRFINPDKPRWAHVDLSVRGDSTGIAIGHIDEFVMIDRGEYTEVWPRIIVDAILEVRPPLNSEIKFFKVREVFYKLTELGLNLRWISFDSYQSMDSIQVLRQRGYITGVKSVDTDLQPYALVKGGIYDKRLIMPEHEKTRIELLSLEYDAAKGKVDHPVGGSKDCSDGLAGTVYGLSTRRELWAMAGVSMDQLPGEIASPAKKDPIRDDDM